MSTTLTPPTPTRVTPADGTRHAAPPAVPRSILLALAVLVGIGAIALGAITCVGGGILRDVLANEQPAVLRSDSELYAVPAVLGAALIVLVTRLHHYGSLTAGLVATLVFALRLAALHYGWRAPTPSRAEE